MYLYTTEDHNMLKTQWQKFSKTEVRHFNCTGSHETILQQPHVNLLAGQILQSLVQCEDEMTHHSS